MKWEYKYLMWNHGVLNPGDKIEPPTDQLPGDEPNREVNWSITDVDTNEQGEKIVIWCHSTVVTFPGEHGYIGDELPPGWTEHGLENGHKYYSHDDVRVGINKDRDSIVFEIERDERVLEMYMKLTELQRLMAR